jgi:hypothetical protein
MESSNASRPPDWVKVRAAARWAYERARLKRALLGVTPLALIVVVALCFASRPTSTMAFALAALALGIVMLWYGREPKRAFLLGAAAGIVPLVLVTMANHIHVCGPSGCETWCFQACCTGGVSAGLLVAYRGHQSGAGVTYWLSASSLALLVGAMGCSCIGVAGLVGLVLGFGAGVIPLALRRIVLRQ